MGLLEVVPTPYLVLSGIGIVALVITVVYWLVVLYRWSVKRKMDQAHKFNFKNYTYLGQEVLINGVKYRVEDWGTKETIDWVLLKNTETGYYLKVEHLTRRWVG